MQEIYDPLFGTSKPSKDKTQVAASVPKSTDGWSVPTDKSAHHTTAAPVSPFDQSIEMQPAFCGDIPVFVDLQARVVYPVRDEV